MLSSFELSNVAEYFVNICNSRDPKIYLIKIHLTFRKENDNNLSVVILYIVCR